MCHSTQVSSSDYINLSLGQFWDYYEDSRELIGNTTVSTTQAMHARFETHGFLHHKHCLPTTTML